VIASVTGLFTEQCCEHLATSKRTRAAIWCSLMEKDQMLLLELPGGLMCPANMALDTFPDAEDQDYTLGNRM